MSRNEPLTPMVRSVHTVLYSKAWEQCVAFYRDVLEFPVVYTNPVFVEFEPVEGARIGLLNAARSTHIAGAHTDYLLSFCVQEVEKVHALLQERCPVVSPIRDHAWGARLFELEDPEGRRLEFWSPCP